MRTIIFILALSPFFSFSQTNSSVFIKLTDAKGNPIKGESKDIKFKDWIHSASISSGGNNNTQLTFTMQISGASADLKKAMTTNEWLLNGEVDVTKPGERPVTLYIIKMEKIKVLSYAETTGSAAVTLQATRIGWIYYSMNNKGEQTESKRYGWDAETNKEWNLGETPKIDRTKIIKARGN